MYNLWVTGPDVYVWWYRMAISLEISFNFDDGSRCCCCCCFLFLFCFCLFVVVVVVVFLCLLVIVVLLFLKEEEEVRNLQVAQACIFLPKSYPISTNSSDSGIWTTGTKKRGFAKEHVLGSPCTVDGTLKSDYLPTFSLRNASFLYRLITTGYFLAGEFTGPRFHTRPVKELGSRVLAIIDAWSPISLTFI